jgi:NAD-reducing hydrogenase large subunit
MKKIAYALGIALMLQGCTYAISPDLAKQAIALRRFGQEIIARVGDRRIHPTFAVPGGVNKALAVADRDAMLAELPAMIASIQTGLEVMKGWAAAHQQEMRTFASFPTGYLGMVGKGNALQLYDGQIRLVGSDLKQIKAFDGRQYLDHIAEHVESWSYLKFPYHRPAGWPAGAYRVGPLGRLNAADRIDTPLAQKEFAIFRQINGGKPIEGTLYYHYARLIEDLYAAERVGQLLDDPEICADDIRTPGRITNHEGVGVIEAPRGTLFHHYWVDKHGAIEKVNLIVATGNNNYAMSRAVEEVAKAYVKGPDVPEGALNRIEAAIRAYDPCLSCSTHAVGQMPMRVEVYDGTGRQVGSISR